MTGWMMDWTRQLPWGLEFVARGAVLMTLLAVALGVLLTVVRVQHPALRHRAWLGLTVGAVLLPIFLAIGPLWQVPAPAWLGAEATPSTLQVPAPVVVGKTLTTLFDAAPVTRDGSGAGPSILQPVAARQPMLSSRPVISEGQAPWWAWAVGVYWVGVLYFAMRLGVGWWLGRRLVAQSAPIEVLPLASDLGTEPQALFQEILGDRSERVQLRLSDQVTAPVCVGGWRPVILLPCAWHHWDAITRRAVLAHELHHVRRGDPQAQLWSLAARCIYWFHPLSWWMLSHLSQLAERSCDARAVAFARGHHAYARLLLQVAGQVSDSRRSMPLALGMDGHRRLSDRVRWLLNRRPSPMETSPMAASFLGSALLVVTLLFGLVDLTTVTAQMPAAPSVPLDLPGDSPAVTLALPDVAPPIAEPQVPSPSELPPSQVLPPSDVVPQPSPAPRPALPMPVAVPVPDPVVPARVSTSLAERQVEEAILDPTVPLETVSLDTVSLDGETLAEFHSVSVLTTPESPTSPKPVTTVASLDVPAVQVNMPLSFPFALPREGRCVGAGASAASGHLILLFDDKNRAARSRPRADLTEQLLGELVDWIEHRVSPCDQVAVMSYQSRLRLHQDFTRDSVALLEAVNAAQRPKAAKEVGLDGALGQALAPEALRRKQSIYKVLEHLADASRRLPGHTTVLLITPGFDENNHFHMEVGPLARLGRAQQRLRKPIASFQKVGTVVHAVNPWPAPEREGLRLLTRETGGWYLFGFQAPVDENVYSWAR